MAEHWSTEKVYVTQSAGVVPVGEGYRRRSNAVPCTPGHSGLSVCCVARNRHLKPCGTLRPPEVSQRAAPRRAAGSLFFQHLIIMCDYTPENHSAMSYIRFLTASRASKHSVRMCVILLIIIFIAIVFRSPEDKCKLFH